MKATSLLAKVLLIIVCVTVVAVAALFLVESRNQARFYETVFTDKGVALARSLDAGITAADLANRAGLQNKLYKFLWLNPDIRVATMHLVQGGKLSVAVTSDPVRAGQSIDPRNISVYQSDQTSSYTTTVEGEPFVVVITPVHMAGKPAGTYELWLSAAGIHEAVAVQARQFFVVAAIAAIISVIGFFIFLRGFILQPISVLTQAAETIAHGNLEYRVPITSSDEIGSLAGAFNHMTEELKSAQEQLEQKVAERTKELENKSEELGKLNAMMVGRELKMAEMKSELEAIRKSPG